MTDSASIWIMILLRKVRTWLYQQYLKWFQTTSLHHQHHHDSTCICFLWSIKLATLVDQIIVSVCCCPTENIAFYLDQIMCPLVHNLSTYVNQWFQFGQHNDSQTLPLHHGHKNNIYCYPITVALKRYLISSTSIPFSTHLQEHTRTLQSFVECFFFFFPWRMQSFHCFQRTCDSTVARPKTFVEELKPQESTFVHYFLLNIPLLTGTWYSWTCPKRTTRHAWRTQLRGHCLYIDTGPRGR